MRHAVKPSIFLFALGVLLAGLSGPAGAQQQEIPFWVIAGGGGEARAGGLTLRGSIGQPVAVSTPDIPGGYSLSAGFWRHIAPAPSGVDDELPGAPLANRLLAPYPNPFNPAATIGFELTVASPVRLRIYDARGLLVRDLVGTEYPAGRHEVLWDGRTATGGLAPSGLYFVRFEAAGMTATRKMSLLK